MNTSILARRLSYLVALILVLLPFHAFLTVWASSIAGHYTALRLWKEFLMVPLFAGTVYLVIKKPDLRRHIFKSWLFRLIATYMALTLIVGLTAYTRHQVDLKALAYGCLVNLRFLGLFLMVMIVAGISPILREKWRLLVLAPATAVIIFGLLQYFVLPYDFLRHFGYNDSTIFPYETLNQNIHNLRIGSTLRGANNLGAYLILVISASVAMLGLFSRKFLSRYVWFAAALLTLFFSFSRSAWVGAVLGISTILWLSIRTTKTKKRLAIVGAFLAVLGGIIVISLHDTTGFKNAIFHTDSHRVETSSNEKHLSAAKDGLLDVVHQPLGRGPGTAGPASTYNNHPPRVAENYFIQIGQEVGVIGLFLFVAINILVARELWVRRNDQLAKVLFASLIGITFVSLLSHAWTDDTLAYLWWGLAGIALAPMSKHKQKRV